MQDFFVGLEAEPPSVVVSLRKLKAFVAKKFGSLNPDKVSQSLEAGEELPRFKFTCKGWAAVLYPIPRPKGRNRQATRSLGMMGPPQMVPSQAERDRARIEPSKAIRKAVRNKVGRYGDLGFPYTVAVNALGEWAAGNWNCVVEALYGAEQMVVRKLPTGGFSEPRMIRGGDGVFLGKTRPVSTRVSAVLVASGLRHWTLANAPLALWHHPWAKLPLPDLLPVEQRRLRDGKLEVLPGKRAFEIMGLHPDWPFPEHRK